MNLPLIANVLWKRRQLRRHDRWTRQQLETHQTRALHLLREYAYMRSPFYQQFHKGLLTRPLHDLPVLTKTMVMAHFDEVVTDRAVRLRAVEAYLVAPHHDEQFLGRYWVNATSGSIGRRGLFLFDYTEWTTILASYARVYA
jgi:phenylacetate-coenzyme A ligase PaaK-like adenylate-forming protein